jgi:hypothetical protein
MPFRPNYRQQRGDRDRAKELNKQERLRRRQEGSANRKLVDGDVVASPDGLPNLPEGDADMGRMKSKAEALTVLFDVFYEDGTRSSNRKVPASEVDSLDGEAAVRSFVEMQDRKIAEMSGNAPRAIARIVRSS